jgi:serine protease Do
MLKMISTFFCVVFFAGALGVFSLPVLAETPADLQAALGLQNTFEGIASKYQPVVVNVTTKKMIKQQVPENEFYFGDPFQFFFEEPGQQPPQGRQRSKPRYYEQKLEGDGSGVIISPEGYVLTNYHVISDADNISVRLNGDEKQDYDATLVGQDPFTDLAIIKIKTKKKFQAAVLGNSDQLHVGDWVVAFGSPFGLEQTVTAGIVSARRQTLIIEGKRYDNMIQTDAAINRGNSGGPLVNLKGEVIGINTAIYAPTGVFSGVGFAIPINRAKEVINELITRGKVIRGYLGVSIMNVDKAIAKQFGITEKQGVLVNGIVKGSAADKGGVLRGDVITVFNNHAISNSEGLQKIVQDTKPGEEVEVTVIRNKQARKLKIRLAEMPANIEETQAPQTEKPKTSAGTAEWKGIKVSDLTNELAAAYNIPEGEKGAVVTGVEATDQAANLGLQEGDLVKGVNQSPVTSAAEFKKAADKIDLSEGLVFDVLRNGVPLYITYQER